MAFNWQTFKTRALTAIVFVVIMMGGLLYNRWSFFLLFTVVHFGGWLEYQKLVTKFNPEYDRIIPVHRYGIMIIFCSSENSSGIKLAAGSVSLISHSPPFKALLVSVSIIESLCLIVKGFQGFPDQ